MAHGSAAEIRLARQFSMGYLQFNVMEHQQLIEKHARALGIPDLKVSWITFNGPAAVNDALISGNIDIATGGVPGLLVLWSRTKGTPQEVRGISALSSQPFLLNSRDPAITTIRDFKDTDRIAVPAIKVSVQAITLQMAAAKAYGTKEFAKLDPLTVSMSPPDATIALMEGKSEVTSVFSVPPFQYQQLDNPAVHTVLNSFDVMGGSHTFTVAWTSAKFRDGNPELYKALVAALKEATEIVNKDKMAAGALWIEDFKIETAARHGRQDRRRPAGALDHDTGKHHEICGLHGRGRHAQDEGLVVAGIFLPGDLRREGELTPTAVHPREYRQIRSQSQGQDGSLMMTIIITAFERSPDGGKGLARDTRVRWALEEVDQPYDVRLLSFKAMKELAHLALHPFGQIPTYEEGDLALFETGAIVFHIAERHAGLLPDEANARARAITWMFAALNTVSRRSLTRNRQTSGGR